MADEPIRRMDTFSFPAYSIDLDTGEAAFEYALDGPGGTLRFTETVTLPRPAAPPSDAAVQTLHRVLELLHLVAGVSYYKVAAPRRVVADTPLRDGAAGLADAVYTKGLAEYAYRNDLPHVLELSVSLPTEPSMATEPSRAPVAESLGGRPVCAVGGGKDSIVTLEALRRAGLEPVPFSVNPNAVITAVNGAAGLPALAARRRIDPQLFALNRAGGYNGHVPVTAINSLIAVATSVLHGLGPVVMSNERSASDPNLTWHGHEINHQWSKGVDAERLLREALTGHAGLTEPYFSFLRPLSELHIAQLFAQFTAYDDVVTSCNAAFKLSGASARWCTDCPKCRFVFLAMAPAMSRQRLVRIFGTDMLADPTQLPGYLALLGLDGHKPFECVGEVTECLVALGLLAEQREWREAAVVRELVAAVPQQGWSAVSRSDVFTPSGSHFIPPAYLKALTALTSP